jgi:hypothetical protein
MAALLHLQTMSKVKLTGFAVVMVGPWSSREPPRADYMVKMDVEFPHSAS